MAPESVSGLKTPGVSFEIPRVSELLYLKTREALAKEGYTFFVNIKPLSIGQLVEDEVKRGLFEHVVPSENMRAIVPPQMEIAINPKDPRIKNSNSKSTDTIIRMIEEREAVIKVRLPKEVRDFINIRIQNTSVLVQIFDKYQRETGKQIFPRWFGATDDQTSPGRVAFAGCYSPGRRLYIGDTNRFRGNEDNNVFALDVVVLPRQLAA